MVRTVQRSGRRHADVAVSTTGVAGDETIEGIAPGTVYIATAVDGCTTAHEYRFEGSPERICDRARHQALLDLATAVNSQA